MDRQVGMFFGSIGMSEMGVLVVSVSVVASSAVSVTGSESGIRVSTRRMGCPVLTLVSTNRVSRLVLELSVWMVTWV